MALFKVSKGTSKNLPAKLTEGYCWYTYDDSKFYIDYKDEDNVLVRKALNAKDAETLCGASVATILTGNELEIPTSKAVFDALVGKNVVGTEYTSVPVVNLDTGAVTTQSAVAGDCAEIFNDYTNNIASGQYSHAEGQSTAATQTGAHAEGSGTIAGDYYTHAEGSSTKAVGMAAHAEGNETAAIGFAAHAEGNSTQAKAYAAHAEGSSTKATKTAAHAEGYVTTASSKYQHVQGKHNIDDPNDKYAHIVGNGTVDVKSNAHTLDWNGNAWFAGNVKIGGTSQDDATAKTLATTEYVDSKVGNGGGGSGWEVLMDVTLDEECVDVIGITLTDAQKEKIANGGDFVCYAECPPPTTQASAGWICGGLWADNMYYFILSAFGQPSGIVPASTDTNTSRIYGNLKNASGDMRIRDMLYTTSGTPHQTTDFMDTSNFMTHYQTQPLTVRFKTNGVFAVGTRLICKVR